MRDQTTSPQETPQAHNKSNKPLAVGVGALAGAAAGGGITHWLDAKGQNDRLIDLMHTPNSVLHENYQIYKDMLAKVEPALTPAAQAIRRSAGEPEINMYEVDQARRYVKEYEALRHEIDAFKKQPAYTNKLKKFQQSAMCQHVEEAKSALELIANGDLRSIEFLSENGQPITRVNVYDSKIVFENGNLVEKTGSVVSHHLRGFGADKSLLTSEKNGIHTLSPDQMESLAYMPWYQDAKAFVRQLETKLSAEYAQIFKKTAPLNLLEKYRKPVEAGSMIGGALCGALLAGTLVSAAMGAGKVHTASEPEVPKR